MEFFQKFARIHEGQVPAYSQIDRLFIRDAQKSYNPFQQIVDILKTSRLSVRYGSMA